MTNQHPLSPQPMALDEFAPSPRWVSWQLEHPPGRAPTKLPHNPHTDRLARSDNSATWGTRDAAKASAARLPRPLGMGGVGIMLGEIGDGMSLGGVDLDTCRQADGTLAAWATEIIGRLASYTEISPSGGGVKVFFRFASTCLPALRKAMGSEHGRTWKQSGKGGHPPGVELHISNRYFTVTGEHLPNTPAELAEVALATLLWIVREAGSAMGGNKPRAAAQKPTNGAKGADERRDLFSRRAGLQPALARFWAGNWSSLADQSASARAFALGAALKRAGFSYTEMVEALAMHADTADWTATKGQAAGGRELERVWDRAGPGKQQEADPDMLANPDMSLLRQGRRPPPELPLDVFGDAWGPWITQAAESAACPPDYVAALLLASVSALIGNARWPRGSPGWAEPPHLWCGVVGDSGSSKSPGFDTLMRDVLPVIERRMSVGFPEVMGDYRLAAEAYVASVERWKADVREAQKRGTAPPLPPAGDAPAEPQSPRLRQTDVTIEKVATLLATAAPKGLLIVRDELAGWLLGMNTYNDSGRQFWIEAYGGRFYRVERQKHPQPIDVPHLAVAVAGGTQPDKLAELMREPDDGLLARVAWFWPDPVPFKISRVTPAAPWAVDALDRLRLLELAPGADPGAPPCPVFVSLAEPAVADLEAFGREMQARQQSAGGLMRSALGKARGTALRLALVLDYLWWCGRSGMESPPATISPAAFAAAAHLVADYLMPMAERVFGDAAASVTDRNATTLARWIVREKAAEIHVRNLQRTVRLPGLRTAELIHGAAAVLVDAGWLYVPDSGGAGGRPKAAYPVNPQIWGLAA